MTEIRIWASVFLGLVLCWVFFGLWFLTILACGLRLARSCVVWHVQVYRGLFNVTFKRWFCFFHSKVIGSFCGFKYWEHLLGHLSVVIPRQGCRTGVWKYVVVVSHNDLKFFSNQKRWCVRKKNSWFSLIKTYLKWKLSILWSHPAAKYSFGSQQYAIKKWEYSK